MTIQRPLFYTPKCNTTVPLIVFHPQCNIQCKIFYMQTVRIFYIVCLFQFLIEMHHVK